LCVAWSVHGFAVLLNASGVRVRTLFLIASQARQPWCTTIHRCPPQHWIASGGGQRNCGRVRQVLCWLFSALSVQWVCGCCSMLTRHCRFELRPYEHALCMQEVRFRDGFRGPRNPFLAVGTGFVHPRGGHGQPRGSVRVGCRVCMCRFHRVLEAHRLTTRASGHPPHCGACGFWLWSW